MASVNGVRASVEQMMSLALANYGHFTTMRLENGRVRGLSLHLARLVQDCATVFGARLDPERVLYCVRHEVGPPSGPLVVRVTVFDPALDITHPAEKADPHILVTTRPAAALPPAPLRVCSRTFHRDSAAVKHVALFGQLQARRAAQADGFDDVLFTDADGRISEGCTWNVGFVDAAGQVVWPDADVLPGVTMRLLRSARGGSAARPVGIGELPSMRVAFATSAAVGVRAIHQVDEVRFPDGDSALAELRKAYAAIPPERL